MTFSRSYNRDLDQDRVAFLFPSGYSYVTSQWGIWAAGGVSVPICNSHPAEEMKYTIQDSEANVLIAHESFEERIRELSISTGIDSVIIVKDADVSNSQYTEPELLPFEENRNALIIYTSGTTGKPKGVVTTHANIKAQVTSLIEAWKWSSNDRLLHVLPLHHVHGVINALTCPLWIGATAEMLPKFDADKVWKRWMAKSEPPITIFMAVPTVYSRLIQHYETLDKETRNAATEAAAKQRLQISGSAALPTPLKTKWKEISNQVLLERYGMTELGMALSCGYDVNSRHDGVVGLPLPGVQARLFTTDDNPRDVTSELDVEGEIQVRGPTVFKEYWRREKETKKEFTEDGWFKTGDIAIRDSTFPDHPYRIMGRASVDIIKSGGYKISALEVEREILTHISNVSDVAVVGVEDQEWGQRVAAVVVVKEGSSLDIKSLRSTLKQSTAPYKIPTLLKLYQGQLPRNAMGKVNKKDLVKSVFNGNDPSIQKA